MFKKLLSGLFVAVLAVALVGCEPATPEPVTPPPVDPPPVVDDPVVDEPDDQPELPDNVVIEENGDWIIGIMSGTITQGEEEYLAAMNMENYFGSDRIIRTTYPDNFGAEMEVTIANILALADAGAEAIVIVQAVPGTIAGIQEVRERVDPNIFFFAGVTQEPPAEVALHADIAIISDDLSMGRVIMEQAYAMGADTFAHISFPRHLGMENIAARRALLYATAQEKGIEWVELTAPDPTTEGIAQAQMFILENVPRWVAEHGQNTAFFSTNCGMQEPLIRQIAAYGGLYPLQCWPSPFHAMPAAFNISMEGNEGDLDFLLSQLQTAVSEAGGEGRFSTWPIPINMMLLEVGVRYSIEFLEGRTSGRHDRAVLENVIDEVASAVGGAVELSNWPLDDGSYIDNFYLVLSDFINF